MKHAFLSVLALLVFCAVPAMALEVGKAAPDFTVKDIAGEEQSLAKYKGKLVVLEWNNPGCPFVRKHYGSGNMQGVQKFAAEKGVIWLSINSSGEGREGNLTAESAKAMLADTKAAPTAYILDPEGALGHLYGAKATPHMFVIGKDGTLVYEGAIDDKPSPDPEDVKTAHNFVKAAIEELLASKPVSTPQTRAYGCSVKYKE